MRTIRAGTAARLGVLATAAMLAAATPGSAQTRPATGTTQPNGEHVMRRLGGATTRFSPPVNTVAALRKMAAANRRDINGVLQIAGLSDISTQVMDALTNGAVT